MYDPAKLILLDVVLLLLLLVVYNQIHKPEMRCVYSLFCFFVVVVGFFLIIDFWKYDPPSRIRILPKKNQSCPGKRPKMSGDSWSITTSETEGNS